MKKAKHKPPSRLRYEKSHPVVSIRVDKAVYEKLNRLKTEAGKSYGDVVREGLGIQEHANKKAYDLGYKAGLKDGRRLGKQFYLGRCSICGKSLQWDLTSNQNKNLLVKIINEAKLYHKGCEQPQ